MRAPSPFYFAFPRLIARCRGQDAACSEKNGVEANLVGALVHLVVYAFAFHFCLTNRPPGQQLLFALPLAFLVWIFWLAVIYAISLLIRLLRRAGLMRDLPQARAQSILIGVMTTAFALCLIGMRGWTEIIGLVWLTAVTLNLLAAAVLALSRPAERT